MKERPYHHLPDGTFRNPKGSPVIISRSGKFSYRTFSKLRKKVGNESILERPKTEQTHRYITTDHEMNLVFSENTGAYLNKTPTNTIPSSTKEKITELPEKNEKAEIINIEEE